MTARRFTGHCRPCYVNVSNSFCCGVNFVISRVLLRKVSCYCGQGYIDDFTFSGGQVRQLPGVSSKTKNFCYNVLRIRNWVKGTGASARGRVKRKVDFSAEFVGDVRVQS